MLGNSFEEYYDSARLSLAGDDADSSLDITMAAPLSRVRSVGPLQRGAESQGRPGCTVKARVATCPAVPPPDAGQPTALKSFGLAATLGGGDDDVTAMLSRTLRGIHSLRLFGGGGDDALRYAGSAPRCGRRGAGDLPGACNVRLAGGSGNDRLTITALFPRGDNLLVALEGGTGDDVLVLGRASVASGFRALFISCGPGDDTLVVPEGLDLSAATAGLEDFGLADDPGPEACEHLVRSP